MEAKTIINISKPVTQSVAAIKALLSWRGRASDPLPSFVELGEGEGKVVLVLSNKRDAYYTTTALACSCPAAIYNHGKACKHQRKYFPEQSTARQSMAATLEQAEANLPRMPARYQRMVQAEADALLELDPERKPFRPFLEDELRPAKAAPSSSSSIPIVDTLGDPTPGELAYWSIAQDRDLWPLCEA